MRRKFSEEYKEQAVKLVLEQGLSQRQACQDLGLGASTLDKWVREAKSQSKQESGLPESEKEELKRLRKEVHTLRMERDILKKATAYFAKNS